MRLYLIFAFLLLSSNELRAEPQICTGFNAESGTWGAQLRPDEHLCAADEAFYATSKPHGLLKGIDYTVGMCCPLPAKDILVGEPIFVEKRCPEGMVATGNRAVKDSAGPRSELRCHAVNREKYELGPRRKGALWGLDTASGPYFWKEEQYIKRSDIPRALRLGVARHDFQEFAPNGCIGIPFGSLMVAKTGKRCKDILFRQLFLREQGDKPRSEMQMYPDCRYVSDPFSTEAKCVN